jgi:hypothetical protein
MDDAPLCLVSVACTDKMYVIIFARVPETHWYFHRIDIRPLGKWKPKEEEKETTTTVYRSTAADSLLLAATTAARCVLLLLFFFD